MTESAELRKGLQSEPPDYARVMALADAYRREGRLNDAAVAYVAAADLNPASAKAFFGAGSAMVELGNDEAAVPLLSAAASKAPKEANYWLAVALALERLRRLPESASAFEAAQALAEEREDIALHLLRVRFKLGLLDRVVAMTAAMQFMAPRYPEVLLTRANALLMLGRSDEANTAAGQALRNFPNDPGVLSAVAAHASLADHVATARQLLERAVRIAPDHYETMIGFGNLALREHDTQTASMWLRRARERDPARWEACLGLAAIALETKDLAALDEWTSKGIDLAPWHPGLLELRGMWFLARNDTDGAEQVLRQAIQINPLHQRAQFDLGHVFLMRSQRTEAHAQFAKVVELAPDTGLGEAARSMLASWR